MNNFNVEYRMTNTMLALKKLRERLPGTENRTKYISCFSNTSGRQIAIEKERQDGIYIWVECHTPEIEGVEIRNRNTPGFPYSRSQSRNSNLNEKTASRLKVGNKVWYLKIEALESFNQFVGRYYAA